MNEHKCFQPQSTVPNEEQLTATGKLLAVASHPARLLVLFALGRLGPQNAGQLQDIAQMEQSAMSHQLAVLRKARLITSQRQGKHVLYALADEHVLHILEDALSHVCERIEHPSQTVEPIAETS